jgi:hypothetical protein
MMHPEDSALGFAPVVSSYKLLPSPAPTPAYIPRMPRELLACCFEPLMSARSGRPTNEKSSPAILHACREFRIVGVDIFYSNSNFVFGSDEQLQHFLTTIPPHYVARVQHIALAFTMTFSWERHDRSRRASGVVNYAALASFPKLRSVHLYISLVFDESVVASWVVARFIGVRDLPRVLAIGT